MIRHVAVFRFTSEFDEARRRHWMQLVADLPRHIPEIRSMTVGPDLVRGPNSHEIAIVADFDSLEDLDVYNRHPAHQPVLDISAPVKESLAVVDFQV